MKKVIVYFIGALLLISITATSVYAGVTHYYSELLYNQKSQMEVELKEEFDEMEQYYGELNHRNLVLYVDDKRVEIIDNVKRYINEDVAEESEERLNEHTRLIDEVAERLERELMEYVNQLKE